MTPDVQAAHDRLTAQIERMTQRFDESDAVTVDKADLRTLLAALDPAETRTEWATRQRHPNGAEQITDPVSEKLARHQVANYPWHTALMHREIHYGPWTEGEPAPAPEHRDAPLTDEPSGATPTPAGTDAVNAYRAHRTQQHPHRPARE